MKRLAWLAAAAAVVACGARPAVSIENAWARATPPGSTVAAVYAQIVATQADELIGVTTASAERVEMHSSTHENGVMKMRPVTTVPLPANERVTFAAGGLHLMLIGLHAPLAADTTIALTFDFRSAPSVTVAATVVAPGSEPAH